MAKQEWLDGMAPKRIQDVHDAASLVLDLKAKEKRTKSKREDAEADLMVAMAKHELDHYAFGGIIVNVEHKEKVKVEGGSPSGEPKTVSVTETTA
jgi:hypothetical protein